MNEQPAVLIDRRDRVLIVTINRPDQRNAVNMDVASLIAEAMDTLDADPELAVAILTGAGKGFCSGMDLKAFANGQRPYIGDRGFGGITQRSAEKPLIAAIEGFALAGGLEIALACDLIVAARGAKLGLPEAKRSIVPASGGLLRLPRLLPRGIAFELALTGESITAERAHELGMINRLCEPGAALAAGLELATTLAANGPLAVAAIKRILVQSPNWSDSEFFMQQAKISEPVLNSEDAREGALAFAERRAPVWRGA
jgi:enoyl-CoA hydratase